MTCSGNQRDSSIRECPESASRPDDSRITLNASDSLTISTVSSMPLYLRVWFFWSTWGRPMSTRRRFPRFRSSIPISVTDHGAALPRFLVPENISAVGCYFSHQLHNQPPPRRVSSVTISLPNGKHLTCGNVDVVERVDPLDRTKKPSRGLALSWDLSPTDLHELDHYIRSCSIGPDTSDRVKFVRDEQTSLYNRLTQLETSRHGRWQLFMTVVLVYLGFLAAPARFDVPLNSPEAFFYGVAGIWGSLALLVMSDRLLEFLGSSTREHATIRNAIHTNRAYVMGNDVQFYDSTVLPLGVTYDPSRSWSYLREGRSRLAETYPHTFRSSLYPTLYIMLLQVLFLGGIYHFIAMLVNIRSTELPTHTNGPIPRIDVFQPTVTYAVFVAGNALTLLWFQLAGNCCLHYHQALWESRRISPERPNPRVTGNAFRRRLEGRIVTGAMYAFAFARMLMLAIAVFESWYTGKAIQQLTVVTQLHGLAWFIVLAFFAVKIYETMRSLRCESVADESALPLARFEPHRFEKGTAS